MSGGREGAVRAWDAAGAEGADVLAALDAGQGSQVSNIIQGVFFYWSALKMTRPLENSNT